MGVDLSFRLKKYALSSLWLKSPGVFAFSLVSI